MKGPLDASTALQQIRRIAVTADVADLVDQHARDRDAIAQAVLLLGVLWITGHQQELRRIGRHLAAQEINRLLEISLEFALLAEQLVRRTGVARQGFMA
ncbi:MAG: hypothetical protein FJX20_06220 [Alphaproteobacteria bacterium]|nr:hypothetical protein [Alphaproteobacteria bacterium]